MATHLSRYRAVVPARIEARAAERLFVSIGRPDGHVQDEAELQDVSPFGCRLAVAEQYQVGEPVSLRIGGAVVISATVVWSEADAMGCRFGQTVPRAMLRQWIIRS